MNARLQIAQAKAKVLGVDQPIVMMRAEHVDHAAMPPEGACNTWRALYAGGAQFHDDLITHIYLENNVLFPQFDAKEAASRERQL